jgi:hypothetical protein
VERVVVSKLADAFEQGSLRAGDQVCLEVETTGKEKVAVLKLNITQTASETRPLGDKINLELF